RLDQLEALVSDTESRLGPIDVLVNNSATNISQGPSLAVTDEMLDKMVEINVKSALRLVRLTGPKMIERKRGGGGVQNGAAPGPALHRQEGRLDHDGATWGARVGAGRRPRQCHPPRPDQARLQRVLLEGRAVPGPPRIRTADPSHRPTARDRPSRALPGVRRGL